MMERTADIVIAYHLALRGARFADFEGWGRTGRPKADNLGRIIERKRARLAGPRGRYARRRRGGPALPHLLRLRSAT